MDNSDVWLSNLIIRLELVSKKLNHLAAILHVYAGGFDFYENFGKNLRKG